MQSKAKSVKQGESSLYNVATSTVYSDLLRSNTRFNSTSPAMMRGSASDSSSSEQSAAGNSQSEGGTGINEEDDDTNKRSRRMTLLQQDKTDKLKDLNLHQVPPASHPRDNGNITQGPQLELVGHSVACGSNPYDSYFGGTFAAYGQPMVPHLYDMHHARMPLPLEMAQDPVYVNAKQYHGILRRRQSRAKAELERKLIKVRKPYLHESRHQHALRRARGTGGRFAKKAEADTSKGSGIGLDTSMLSRCPEHFLSNSNGAEVWQQNTNLQEPAHRFEDGSANGQKWANVASNHILGS